MVLLAKNNDGYHNLIKLVSESHVDNFYYKPRTTLPCCKYGVHHRHHGLHRRHRAAPARQYAVRRRGGLTKKLASCFEPGDFYIELQNQGVVTDAGHGPSSEPSTSSSRKSLANAA